MQIYHHYLSQDSLDIYWDNIKNNRDVMLCVEGIVMSGKAHRSGHMCEDKAQAPTP